MVLPPDQSHHGVRLDYTRGNLGFRMVKGMKKGAAAKSSGLSGHASQGEALRTKPELSHRLVMLSALRLQIREMGNADDSPRKANPSYPAYHSKGNGI